MNLTLQELCLREIILKFDTYLPYFTAENIKLNRPFTFLLRVYSEEIISELYDLHQLEFKHADVLINKYLTSVNTDWFRTQNWEIIAAKMVSIGSTLKKLQVHLNTNKMPWKAILCYLPNLESISFCKCSCSDEVLEYVAEFCPNVVEILVGWGPTFTLKGIKHLGIKENGRISCPKLKRLCISSTDLDRKDAKYILENFPYLEYIEHSDLPDILFERHQKDVLCTHKTVSYNLTCLRIDNYFHYTFPEYNDLLKYDDLLKVCFSVCPRLKELRCDLYSEEHLGTVSNLKNLTKLDVTCDCHPALNLNGLLKCVGSTLKSLKMRECRVSVLVLAESCPLLEALMMHRVHFETDDESSVPVFHHLSSCTLRFLPEECYQQARALLLASYRLTHVHFKSCGYLNMETGLLEVLSRCPLRRIRFSNCVIQYDFAVKILVSCPNLSVLMLVYMKLRGNRPQLNRDLHSIALTLATKPSVFFLGSNFETILNRA